MTTEQHLYREELTEDEFRDLKIDHLADGIENGADLLCKKAGLPIRGWGPRRVLMLDKCWCPEPHVISTESDCPSSERMRILGKVVLCPVHGSRFNVHQLLDILPLGKRKSVQNRDELLAKINWSPEQKRFYVFESGEGDGMTQAIDTNPVAALDQVRPSPKQVLRGMVFEVSSVKRVRELLELKGDDISWRTDLAGLLRDDLSLPPSWHGCSLNDRERMLEHAQKMETALQQRKARLKLIEKMKRDADRLAL